jgi:hypothetical protein
MENAAAVLWWAETEWGGWPAREKNGGARVLWWTETEWEFFLNFFNFIIRDFAKIYGLSQILQKYTSAAVAHGVRDITPWPTSVGADRNGPLVWDKHSVVSHGVRGLAPWATTAAGLLAPWATGLGSDCLYNTEIQSKMS